MIPADRWLPPGVGIEAATSSPRAMPFRCSTPQRQRVSLTGSFFATLGVAMPTIIYIIWGIMELVQIPVSPP